MKGIINIKLESKKDDYIYAKKYEIQKDINYDYSIQILTDLNEKFEVLITNYKELKDNIESLYKEINMLDIEELQEDKLFLKTFINKSDNFYKELFNNCEFIRIEYDGDELKEYLFKNKELSSKKILLFDYFNLNSNIKSIEKDLKDYNIYVEIYGNDMPIKIEDLKKTQEIINGIVQKIKKYDLSPIEQIMYAFDIVRDKIYCKESENDPYYESRDLTRALLGNKIVCAGYATIFEIILKKLNINNKKYYVKSTSNKNSGHAYNMAYIKDKKYDINGVYYFDATWDRKRDESNNFLDRYKYFALTKNTIERYQNYSYIDNTLPSFSENLLYDFIDEYQRFGLKNMNDEIINTINTLSRLIDNKTLITKIMRKQHYELIPSFLKKEFDLSATIKSINKYKKLMDKKISSEKLLKILFNVRKVEYYNNPNKYKLDLETIYKIIINSNWKFFNETEVLLLKAIFGDDYKINSDEVSNMIRTVKKNEIDVKINQIVLTKTLKNIYESKKTEKKY